MARTRRLRRSKHKSRKHRGGKYVGEGSYGCGYLPALRCEGEAERAPGMFSKLMEAEEAQKEFDIGVRWFKPVDPDHKYFLYPKKICPINQAVLPNPENNTERCQDKFDTLDDARLLQFYNGGIDPSKIHIDAEDYIPYFSAFKNLFDGLSKLHKKNIAHMDIKTGNLVGMKDTPTSFHFRFIDFGLAMNINESYATPIDDEKYMNDYFAWPFDTRFIYKWFDESLISFSRVKRYFMNAVHFQTYIPLEIFYASNNTDYSFDSNDFKRIYDMFLYDIPDEEKLGFITKGTDVFSLGQVLSILYAKKIGHYYRHGGKLCLDPRDSTRKILLSDLQPLIPADVYAWHQEVFDTVSIPIYNLVKQMMDLNPFNRITIDTAKQAFVAILPQIARLFKPDLIRKGLRIYNTEISPLPPPPPSPGKTPIPFPLSPLNKPPLERQMGQRRLVLRPNAPAFVPGKGLSGSSARRARNAF